MRTRQGVSHQFSHLFKRIERLRITMDLKWEELAVRMDVSPSLFFQVKRGNCGLSPRNLHKLETLEKEVGFHVENPVGGGDLIKSIILDERAVEVKRELDAINDHVVALGILTAHVEGIKKSSGRLLAILSAYGGVSSLQEVETLRQKPNADPPSSRKPVSSESHVADAVASIALAEGAVADAPPERLRKHKAASPSAHKRPPSGGAC
jgi:hypothetical protein